MNLALWVRGNPKYECCHSKIFEKQYQTSLVQTLIVLKVLYIPFKRSNLSSVVIYFVQICITLWLKHTNHLSSNRNATVTKLLSVTRVKVIESFRPDHVAGANATNYVVNLIKVLFN